METETDRRVQLDWAVRLKVINKLTDRKVP